jgi:hypothetical protein
MSVQISMVSFSFKTVFEYHCGISNEFEGNRPSVALAIPFQFPSVGDPYKTKTGLFSLISWSLITK